MTGSLLTTVGPAVAIALPFILGLLFVVALAARR